MPRCDQGDALADEGWYPVDDESVDLVLIEKGCDEPRPTHHPDILPRRRAQAPRKCRNRLCDELDGRRRLQALVRRRLSTVAHASAFLAKCSAPSAQWRSPPAPRLHPSVPCPNER